MRILAPLLDAPGDVLTSSEGVMGRREAAQLVSDGGAAVLDGGNVFTGPQLFSDVVGLNVEPGYVMANELGELVSVPRPFAERDGIMVNPPEDGEFFIVIHNDSTVDVDNAVVRGGRGGSLRQEHQRYGVRYHLRDHSF